MKNFTGICYYQTPLGTSKREAIRILIDESDRGQGEKS